MPNKFHMMLCIENVKYLARKLVVLSKKKREVSKRDLEDIWPRNLLTYPDIHGKNKFIKDDVILIEGDKNDRYNELAISLVPENRWVACSDTTILVDNSSKSDERVMILDGFSNHDNYNATKVPDLRESIRAAAKDIGTQMILISEGPFLLKDILSEQMDLYGLNGITSIQVEKMQRKGDIRQYSIISDKHGHGIVEINEEQPSWTFPIIHGYPRGGFNKSLGKQNQLPNSHLTLTPEIYDKICVDFHADMKLHESLNLVSKAVGYRDWHSLNGAFKNLSRDADISLTPKQPHDMMP